MGSLADHIYDLSFVEEVFAYLASIHGVHALVVDSDGRTVPVADGGRTALAADRYVPLEFQENIGGVRFTANDEGTLEKASTPIKLCINAIDTLLQRELELRQTGEEMLKLSEQLSFLARLSAEISGINRIDTFCRIVLEEISAEIKADYAFIVTTGKLDEEQTLTCDISAEHAARLQEQEIFRRMLDKAGTALFSLDEGTSVLLVPIRKKEGSNGFMAFFRNREKRFFTSYEKKFVDIIEHIISPCIETLKLYDSLQELYLNTVKALAAAIDAKDEYTHGHSFRVAEFSVAIGREMHMAEKMLQHLEIAAYMHDLGKIGVPERILGKAGKLTTEEYDEIKKHPLLTLKILQPIRLPSFIVDAAVQHHERLDGRGYPFGLKGEKISDLAKIIAVADVFDAMTSKRPYRKAMPVEKALTIICNGIDSEFDRQAVIALLAALKNEEKAEPLAHIATELKFENFIHLNNFLLELSNLLTGDHEQIFQAALAQKI